jgi:hypothetical protein
MIDSVTLKKKKKKKYCATLLLNHKAFSQIELFL